MTGSRKWAFLPALALMVVGPFTSSARAQMGDIPQFLPTGNWQVQKTVLSEVRGLQGVDLPCMMAGSYDNGYGLRLSGTGQEILAMAVDFRQNIFTRGQRYAARLSMDDQYRRTIKGTAFSEGVLIFNMRDYEGFHTALSKGRKMHLDVEDNPMIFSLGGVADGLKKLERCSTGGDYSANIEQASLPLDLPSKSVSIPRGDMMTPSISRPVPEEGRPADWKQEVTPVPARISKSIQKSATAKGPLWAANAGDDMKATLDGWAKRAGVKLDWKATGDAKVADNVRVQGSFEEAVQTLMAQNAAALGLDANMRDGGASGMNRMSTRVSMPVGNGPQQLTPHHMGRSTALAPSESTSVSTIGGAVESRWSALMGASLEQVLQEWCARAGVELVWQSNQGFSVKRAVASSESYEAALQSLLNQYRGERVHPVAQLNNDPVTGRRVLFIESSRVL